MRKLAEALSSSALLASAASPPRSRQSPGNPPPARICERCGARIEPILVPPQPTPVLRQRWVLPSICRCEDQPPVDPLRQAYEEQWVRLARQLWPSREYDEARLATFLARPGTERALQLARELIQRQAPPGLLLFGCEGSGKTRLAMTILHELQALQPRWRCLAVTIPHLLQMFRNAQFRQGEDDPLGYLLDRLKRAHVLLLDDIGAEAASDWTEDRLYLVVDGRKDGITLATSNLNPDAFYDRSPRIAGRIFQMCEVELIRADSFRKEQMLRRMQARA